MIKDLSYTHVKLISVRVILHQRVREMGGNGETGESVSDVVTDGM